MATVSWVRWPVVLGCVLVAAACAAPPSPPPAPPTPAPVFTPPPLPADQAYEACAVPQAGGTYVLWVESPQEGDLTACAGGRRLPGGLPQVQALPGISKRCVLTGQTIPFRATITVYGGSTRADDVAANNRCRVFGAQPTTQAPAAAPEPAALPPTGL